MVTSINQEGTGNGFDLELTRRIAEAVPIPVIAGGGAGKISDVYDAIVKGKTDAVCMASILHYNYIRQDRAQDADYSQEGNTEFLRRGMTFSKIQDASLAEIKSHLAQRGIECRRQEVAHA